MVKKLRTDYDNSYFEPERIIRLEKFTQFRPGELIQLIAVKYPTRFSIEHADDAKFTCKVTPFNDSFYTKLKHLNTEYSPYYIKEIWHPEKQRHYKPNPLDKWVDNPVVFLDYNQQFRIVKVLSDKIYYVSVDEYAYEFFRRRNPWKVKPISWGKYPEWCTPSLDLGAVRV